MNCRQHHEALQDLIDKSLDQKGLADIKAHLRSCQSCMSEYRALRKIAEGLERLPIYETSPDFNRAVFRRLGLDYKPSRLPVWMNWSIAGGLGLVVFWMSTLAAGMLMLLAGSKPYKLVHIIHNPGSLLSALQDAVLGLGLYLYQSAGFIAKTAGWLLKVSPLPGQVAAASLLACFLITLAVRTACAQTKLGQQ